MLPPLETEVSGINVNDCQRAGCPDVALEIELECVSNRTARAIAGAGFSCAPLSTDVDNLNIPAGRLVPRLRPDSVMVTDAPLVIAAPVVMMIAVLVDVDAEATPVQDGMLHVTVAVQMK